MEEVIKVLKDLKNEMEYLMDAPGDVELRKKRIDALDEAIMRLEDLEDKNNE